MAYRTIIRVVVLIWYRKKILSRIYNYFELLEGTRTKRKPEKTPNVTGTVNLTPKPPHKNSTHRENSRGIVRTTRPRQPFLMFERTPTTNYVGLGLEQREY